MILCFSLKKILLKRATFLFWEVGGFHFFTIPSDIHGQGENVEEDGVLCNWTNLDLI